MALLHSYFDASFTEPKGVTAIGGYLGTEDQWTRVKNEWVENLALWKLKKFHLTELLAGRLNVSDPELCALTFARIMHKSGLHGLHAALRDEDFTARDYDSSLFPGAYHVCLDMLLGNVAEHMWLEFPDDLVAIVMDSDTPQKAAAEAVFERQKELSGNQFASFTISSQARCRVLECADLLAGEHRKSWLKSKSWHRPETGRIYDIAQGVRSRGSYWSAGTEREIEKILAKLKGGQAPSDG